MCFCKTEGHSLTERSLHVIGRTSLGMPDQLCLRSSSVTAQSKIETSTVNAT